jgi:hypothetical protein
VGGILGGPGGVGSGSGGFTYSPGKTLERWDINGSKGKNKAKKQADKITKETGDRPELTAFKSILDAQGNLGDAFRVSAGPLVTAGNVNAGAVGAGQLDLNALKSDPRALDAMRSRALGGESPWLKMQLEKQGLEELTARDRAGEEALSGAALARSQLAMRGGLSGGARERIAMGAERNLNATRQGVGRAGQMDRLSLGIADDQTKMALLNSTAGLDLSHGAQAQDMSKFNVGTKLDADKFNTGLNFDAQKFNVANTFDADKFNAGNQQQVNLANQSAQLGGRAGENTFNMDKFKTDMMGYAAGKQGAAIAGAGAGGGKKW